MLSGYASTGEPRPRAVRFAGGSGPAVVTTNGPFALTLDIAESSYTAPLSWYWAILVNNQLVWITSAGASATAAPLAVAPPAALTNVSLITSTLPAGSTLTSFFFFVDNNGATVALDAIAVTRPLP